MKLFNWVRTAPLVVVVVAEFEQTSWIGGPTTDGWKNEHAHAVVFNVFSSLNGNVAFLE